MSRPSKPLLCRDLADAIVKVARNDPESMRKLAGDIELRPVEAGLDANSAAAQQWGCETWTPYHRAA